MYELEANSTARNHPTKEIKTNFKVARLDFLGLIPPNFEH